MALVGLIAGWLALLRNPMALAWFLTVLHTIGLGIWVDWRSRRPHGSVSRGLPEKAANLFGWVVLFNWNVLPAAMGLATAMPQKGWIGAYVCIFAVGASVILTLVMTSIVLDAWMAAWPQRPSPSWPSAG